VSVIVERQRPLGGHAGGVVKYARPLRVYGGRTISLRSRRAWSEGQPLGGWPPVMQVGMSVSWPAWVNQPRTTACTVLPCLTVWNWPPSTLNALCVKRWRPNPTARAVPPALELRELAFSVDEPHEPASGVGYVRRSPRVM